MDTQPISLSDEQNNRSDLFIWLVFGLQACADAEFLKIPGSLRRAFNELALRLGKDFPKTLHNFIRLCHQPVSSWYPYPLHDFNASLAILDEGKLSEEAQEYCFDLTERMQLPANLQRDIPQVALDNLKMIDLRHRLKNSPDRQAAQEQYVKVRSFLIENSWATLEQLREQSAILQELREFYEEIRGPSVDDLVICSRCGLLEWTAGSWRGIKPGYCSDHGSGSPYLQSIKNTGQLWRLKRGIHLRTFLPGRIELALFELAENLQGEYPDHLIAVERYPGFDTYDLRLAFSDGEIWALDAKDHTQPERLVRAIQPLYCEGDLTYHHAFYVIPDRRMNEWGYRDTLESTVGSRLANLHIASLSEFRQQVEEKLKILTKPPRSPKGKRT